MNSHEGMSSNILLRLSFLEEAVDLLHTSLIVVEEFYLAYLFKGQLYNEMLFQDVHF